MATFEDLWDIANEFAAESGHEPATVFDPCGLILARPPLSCYGYDSTPLNTDTFAYTGVDGVHYGFLREDGAPAEVVVMTAPMAFESENHIIAESFDEFLGLGYHAGWSALEQIAYDPAAAIEYHNKPDTKVIAGEDDGLAERERLLAVLRARLPILHRPLSEARLAELQAKYAGMLRLRPAES